MKAKTKDKVCVTYARFSVCVACRLSSCHYNIRKYSFGSGAVNMCNSLPNDYVVECMASLEWFGIGIPGEVAKMQERRLIL